MSNTSTMKLQKSAGLKPKKSLWQDIVEHKVLFFMLLPGLALILLFSYGPMYGLIIAFKDYNISQGIWGSPWVGLKHFRTFFTDPNALNTLKNTLLISIYRLLWGFPAPIILALLINEIGNQFYKRIVQTISYLPHFISWVVLAGVITSLLSPNTGVVNYIIKSLGGESIYFMTDTRWFRTIIVASGIWKEAGWGTVIYLAALSGIDPEMYEAAIMDGATRMQRIRHITMPSLMPVISIVLILNMGGIMNAGFDQVFNMYNPMVFPVADIIDTYVYRMGLVGMQYSFSTAVGLFKSVVGLVLMITVNAITRRFGSTEYGLW